VPRKPGLDPVAYAAGEAAAGAEPEETRRPFSDLARLLKGAEESGQD